MATRTREARASRNQWLRSLWPQRPAPRASPLRWKKNLKTSCRHGKVQETHTGRQASAAAAPGASGRCGPAPRAGAAPGAQPEPQGPHPGVSVGEEGPEVNRSHTRETRPGPSGARGLAQRRRPCGRGWTGHVAGLSAPQAPPPHPRLTGPFPLGLGLKCTFFSSIFLFLF